MTQKNKNYSHLNLTFLGRQKSDNDILIELAALVIFMVPFVANVVRETCASKKFLSLLAGGVHPYIKKYNKTYYL